MCVEAGRFAHRKIHVCIVNTNEQVSGLYCATNAHSLNTLCSMCVSVVLFCTYYSKRQLVMATSGGPSVKENIAAVFGQKQVIHTHTALVANALWC